MKKIFFTICGLFLFIGAKAQVRVGFENNSQWYVDDKKIKIDEKEAEDRFRSNSYLKVDYDWKNWSFGAQVEGYEPKAILNYSPDYKGFDIGTLYARYNNRELGLDITAGHFYDQFGSGLLFRSWEDRQLGINNAILGLNAKYSFLDHVDVTLLGGKQRVGMGFDLANSFILGGDINVDLAGLTDNSDFEWSAGFSYLGRFENTRLYNKDLDKLTNGFSGRMNFGKGGFYVGAEYIYKDKDALVEIQRVKPGVLQAGNAILINTGYAKKGMAIDVNMRRMENMSFYSQRDLAGNDYFKGTLNYIPGLTKQYDYSLQNIYVYQAQPNFDMEMQGKLGEIGGQFDFYYEFPKGSLLGGEYGTNVVVNGAYWASVKNTQKSDKSGTKSEFLGFGEKSYSDLGLEVRKKWSSDWSSIFMFLNQYYSPKVLEDKVGVDSYKINILAFESTYQFMGDKSVRLEAQHLWTKEDKKNWVGGTLEFAYNANWAVFVNDMYNYGNDDKDARIHYYNAGASFTKGTTRVSASYGRQRGGLLCVGGVCRYVTEAAGLTFGITTSF
ncbi:DUF6029 family protein [Myroides sp. TSA_177.3]|uniref:DUF6029 family protein n=1 Tax=Myroides sp. TSA_177.3 TaxID=3415650 RepID=UPI0040454BB1